VNRLFQPRARKGKAAKFLFDFVLQLDVQSRQVRFLPTLDAKDHMGAYLLTLIGEAHQSDLEFFDWA
jgi:hypothetical protein